MWCDPYEDEFVELVNNDAVKTFDKKEIQETIDSIQLKNETPDFMKVVIIESFDLEHDGTFRGKMSGEAFFRTSLEKTNEELLNELACALIETSL